MRRSCAAFSPSGDRVAAAVPSSAEGIDRVFMTGGTSLVPAVRELFERRFGDGRLAAGGEFVSVAEGLALMGREASQPPV